MFLAIALLVILRGDVGNELDINITVLDSGTTQGASNLKKILLLDYVNYKVSTWKKIKIFLTDRFIYSVFRWESTCILFWQGIWYQSFQLDYLSWSNFFLFFLVLVFIVHFILLFNSRYLYIIWRWMVWKHYRLPKSCTYGQRFFQAYEKSVSICWDTSQHSPTKSRWNSSYFNSYDYNILVSFSFYAYIDFYTLASSNLQTKLELVDFYNWNRVWVSCCNGSSFTDDVEYVDPVSRT